MASCPRCGSPDVLGKKFGFGDVSVHEYFCKACEVFEDRLSTDPDFTEWKQAWLRDVGEREDEDEVDEDEVDEDGVDEDEEHEDEVEVDETEAKDEEERAPVSRAERDALFDAICRDVSNDALRLRYADLIARWRPELAEFIRLQVERARAERTTGVRRSAPGAREADLRARFGKDWARYIAPHARPLTSDGRYRGYEFERGFIAELRTDPDMVADPREYLFKSAPLEHLDLTSDGPVLEALAAPRMAQIRSISLRQLGLGDDDMVALARDARLDRCEWLDLRTNQIGERGVQALAASPRIRSIPVVLLAFNPCDPATQYSDDGSGYGEMWLPPEGQALEATYGWIPWLHLPPPRRQTDRYHAANVVYVDEDLGYAAGVTTPTEPATRYFIVGARPVRLVPRPDGGLGVEAIDWQTGEMVRATQYLSRVIHGDNEVDEVSAEEFDRAVAEIRERLK